MLSQLKGVHKRILPEGLRTSDLVIYLVVIVLCFVLFQQTDLFHTSSSSYAYLHGHIADFYDYNKNLVQRNDYLPLIYVIFAGWNIPLKLLRLMHNVAAGGITLSVVELVWAKLLLVVFYFATTYLVFLIGKAISGQTQKAKYTAVIFATSPIVVFTIFIFGQYDIFSLFFTMLGFYFYLRRDYLKFSIFFSIAISFKYFPLIIFIPLLLLAEKRILHIVKYGLISAGATVIQVALYYHSAIFRSEIFTLADNRLSGLANLSLSVVTTAPYLSIIYAVICIYAYIKNIDEIAERNKVAVFISLLSYAVMFSNILWHPQWFILMMPFFALSYLYIKEASKSYLIDIVGMFSFTYIVVDAFRNNLDVTMLQNGVLRSLFSYIPLSNYQLFLPQFINLFMGIFFVYLFSPLLVLIFQKTNQDNNLDIKNANPYLRSRYLWGVAIFVIPSLFCALAPKNIAQIIDPLAYTFPGLSIQQAESLVGNITENTSVQQSFIAEKNNLISVSVKFSTLGRVNHSRVTLTLLDENNHPLAAQTIDASKMIDNEVYRFNFKPIDPSKGKRYFLKITSNADAANSISAWKSNADVYPSGTLLVNGKTDAGDLCITLYYDE